MPMKNLAVSCVSVTAGSVIIRRLVPVRIGHRDGRNPELVSKALGGCQCSAAPCQDACDAIVLVNHLYLLGGPRPNRVLSY